MAYDIVTIEWFEVGGFGIVATDDRLLKVTEFSAAGEIKIRHQGTKKYKFREPSIFRSNDWTDMIEKNRQLDAELINEGWQLADPKLAYSITGAGSNLAYVRRSAVPNPR